MATVKYEILSDQKKADGTRNVKIRVIHNRKSLRISTHIFVKDSDISMRKTGTTIKNQIILMQVNEILDNYRRKLNNMGISCLHLTCKEVVDRLVRKDELPDDIDFFAFSEEYIHERKNAQPGTMHNYTLAISSLRKYLTATTAGTAQGLPILAITHTFLTNYVSYMDKMRKSSSNRAVCLYLACIRHLHKQARFTYNRPEEGKILIPFNPFEFFKLPAETAVDNRTVSPDTIRKIYGLAPLMNKMTRNEKQTPISKRVVSEKNCRYNLAKDVFILSFCLIGMNSSDLYTCTKLENGTITYNRDKTKSRRTDKAKMKVAIPEIVKHLVEKYRDPSGKHVFRFYKMYSTPSCFNSAINKGLKQIGAELGISDLEYYAARHSWATIARNDVRIDKYTVHQCLNHIDADMKVTDRYIDRTFAIENEANAKVIKFVFGTQH